MNWRRIGMRVLHALEGRHPIEGREVLTGRFWKDDYDGHYKAIVRCSCGYEMRGALVVEPPKEKP